MKNTFNATDRDEIRDSSHEELLKIKNEKIRLAAGPGWELSSHQGLVLSRSWSWLGMGPGAPISRRFGPIPSHEKKFPPIPILWDAGMRPGWDGTFCPMLRNASVL